MYISLIKKEGIINIINSLNPYDIVSEAYLYFVYNKVSGYSAIDLRTGELFGFGKSYEDERNPCFCVELYGIHKDTKLVGWMKSSMQFNETRDISRYFNINWSSVIKQLDEVYDSVNIKITNYIREEEMRKILIRLDQNKVMRTAKKYRTGATAIDPWTGNIYGFEYDKGTGYRDNKGIVIYVTSQKSMDWEFILNELKEFYRNPNNYSYRNLLHYKQEIIKKGGDKLDF